MFQNEAIERMVLDAFDEMCADAGIEGTWADEGPMGLALVPDPLRLGAAVDLWMRIENREETARQGFVDRMSILGSHQLETPEPEESGDAGDAAEDGAADPSEEEAVESPEPLLDEIELRGRLLVDVLTTVSQQLSERRGALELGEALPSMDAVRDAMIESITVSFADQRLADLWERGTFIGEDAS
jgi:hypothetical protein